MRMRTPIRGLIWAALGTAALFILGCGAFRTDDPRRAKERERQLEPAESAPPLTIEGLHMEEFHGVGKQMDLWSAKGQFYREDGKLHLQQMRILWSAPEGNPSSRYEVSGNEATYDLTGQIAVIRGDVKIRSMTNDTIYTEMVRYDARRERIESPEAVRMEGPDGLTEGVGLQVDLKDETVILQEQVRTIMQPSAFQRAKEALP